MIWLQCRSYSGEILFFYKYFIDFLSHYRKVWLQLNIKYTTRNYDATKNSFLGNVKAVIQLSESNNLHLLEVKAIPLRQWYK